MDMDFLDVPRPQEPLIPEPRVTGTCPHPHCKGDIVETFLREDDPSTGPPIYGPGGQNQMRIVSNGYHCKGCGTKFVIIVKPKPA